MRGGELLEHIRKKKFYSEKEASKIVKQIIDAVAWLHKNGVIHRDLKPENLLYTSEGEDAVLKIADFGIHNECIHVLTSERICKIYRRRNSLYSMWFSCLCCS